MAGISWKPVEGPLGEELRKNLSESYGDFVEVHPGHLVLSIYHKDWYQRQSDFPIKKDDLWVITYPKSGTTWMQEVTWCVVMGIDHPQISLPLMMRFPFFEWDSMIPPDFMGEKLCADDPCLPGNTWKIMANMSSPRTIKSHLQMPLLPKQMWEVKPKIIYVCRDPRDVCVSYYFHSVKLDSYKKELSDFVELFLADMVPFAPFWSHILDFWRRRDQENILFVRFEDMKEDLPSVVQKVADFLGKQLSAEEVMRIADHCSFGSMSKNKAVNNESIAAPESEKAKGLKFMRKGKVGDWKNHLTDTQIKAFKEWTFKHLEGSDFPYYRDYE
uniref:Sulfotransferase domain-containing protein n=1 Tax=Scylla olivacea TaxID=85551 RepID=A0A0P4VZL1_SCYOL